jgi:hypothetical protein
MECAQFLSSLIGVTTPTVKITSFKDAPRAHPCSEYTVVVYIRHKHSSRERTLPSLRTRAEIQSAR